MKALTLIVSENEFLASVELDRVRARWVKKGYGVEEVPGDDPQAVFYALDTQSLFGDGRFVIVRGASPALESEAERLAAWAADPPPAVAAALVTTKAPKIRKAVGARADVHELEPPKPWAVADWLVGYVKGGGRVMTKEGAAALVDAVGTDLRELATAVEQLAMVTTGSIGPDTVATLFRGVESQLYTLLEAVVARDRSSALRHLSALMGAGEHPLVIVNALAKQFRALAAAREPGRKAAPVLAREIGVSPGYVNRAYKHGRNFDLTELRRAFRQLADADYALKGGERGDEQPDALIMELLIGELTGDPRHVAAVRGRR